MKDDKPLKQTHMIGKQGVCCYTSQGQCRKTIRIWVLDLNRPRRESRLQSTRVLRICLGNLAPTYVPGRYQIYGWRRSSCPKSDSLFCKWHGQTYKIAPLSHGALHEHSLLSLCGTPGSWLIIAISDRRDICFKRQSWYPNTGRRYAHRERNQRSQQSHSRKEPYRDRWTTTSKLLRVHNCRRHRRKLRQNSTHDRCTRGFLQFRQERTASKVCAYRKLHAKSRASFNAFLILHLAYHSTLAGRPDEHRAYDSLRPEYC